MKNFTTNRFVGLYVTAQNGSPPFSALDIQMTATSQFISSSIAVLSDSTGQTSLTANSVGFAIEQTGRSFNLNGCDFYGSLNPDDPAASFDTLVPRYFMDQKIADGLESYLRSPDGYEWTVAPLSNSIGIKKLSDLSFPFVL